MKIVFNEKKVKKRFRRLRRTCAYSFSGFCYYLWLKLKRKTLVVRGQCRECGRCCTSLCLEGNNGWLRHEDEFKEIVASHEEYSRFVITGSDQMGFLLFRCTWLTPRRRCLDYNNRLPLCEKFPDKSLPFAGAALPRDCGYRFEEVRPFKKILKKEIERQG